MSDNSLNLTIRPMVEADLPAVLAIERESFASPWSLAVFRRELHDKEVSHLLVAEVSSSEGGQWVVGYACYWHVLDEAHITNIAVKKGYRRRGVGCRLLTQMIQTAKLRGAKRATLEVRLSNEAAQRLYERHGFQAAAIRKGYYPDNGEDALVMWSPNL